MAFVTATQARSGLQLPFRFDPAILKYDLALVAPEEWSPHYNERDFGGNWEGVALRSLNGSERDLRAGPPGEAEFLETPLGARCQNFRAILELFQCHLKAVRLLSLAPGSFIKEHTDDALDFDGGEVRIHIPVLTNPGVEFYVCGERLLLEEGGCYYVNVNLPHRVNNRGDAPRIHLVIDAVVDDWVRETFAQSSAIIRCAPPRGFAEFAEVVFADPKLRDRLRGIESREVLRDAVQREAAARGFEVNEADIAAQLRGAPSNPEGWIPTGKTNWIYAPDHRFTGPFFHDDVRVCLRSPFTKMFRREAPLTARPRIRPDGLIFHISRCGSTLVSRSLAAAANMHVLSEPAPVDEAVQSGDPDQLEWAVSSLARPGRKYLIKLDAWHTRSLSTFRALYPDVPWVFVYRDPMEVLVSQLRQGGMHCMPGAMPPELLGMTFQDMVTLSRAEWCTRVISSFMAAALEFRGDPNGLFVDYNELPGAICARIAPYFGLELDDDDIANVTAATMINAKNPSMPFASDREEKRQMIDSLEAGPSLEAMTALYRKLKE